MTAFIKHENQHILWNAIHNIDLFHDVLAPNQKPVWFKHIIGAFYEKNRDRRLSRQELENLNRQVIEYMISSLKQNKSISMEQGFGESKERNIKKRVSFHEEMGAAASANLYTQPIQSSMRTIYSQELQENEHIAGSYVPSLSSNNEKKTIQSQHMSSDYVLPNMLGLRSDKVLPHSEQYVSEYSARQQEYEQMMKRETPPDMNFKEELSDSVIKNMDELLEKQRRLRELDIPPPPPQILTKQPYNQKEKLLILEEEENPQITPDILYEDDFEEIQESRPKYVKDIMEMIEGLKQEIFEIKQKVFSVQESGEFEKLHVAEEA